MKEKFEALHKLNVLIVEDGNDIREVMSTTFNKISNHVWDAVDGQEGLSKFKEMKPDVVITDLRMPNMNGNEMIEQIKEMSPNTPVIVVSGHGRIIKATPKADVVMEKPIKFDKLVNYVYDLTR